MARQRRAPSGRKAVSAGGKAASAAGRIRAPKPRQRDYAAEYKRRQARARAQGYRSYYAKRVSGTLAGTEARARARGHRGFRDLLASIREGDLVSIDPVASERNPDGTWARVRVDLLGEDGEERHFWLAGRQLDDRKIRQLVKAIDDAGGVQAPGISTSPGRLLSADVEAEAA